jgi:uncharacterized membrane protein
LKRIRKKSRFLRNTLLTGLLILIPLVATYLLVSFLFDLLSGAGAPVMKALFGSLGLERFWWLEPITPLVNIFLALAIIFLLGLVGTNFIGRQVLEAVNTIILRLPLISSVYSAVKQMVENFQGPSGSFQRVVLLQYPRKGMWVMGLVAAERDDALGLASAPQILSVFVPTTPNPTSGFLVMVPPEEVVEVDYTVEEAFKFIVSSGIVGHDFVRKGKVALEKYSGLDLQ